MGYWEIGEKMKKPVSRFALAIWVIAGIYLAVTLFGFVFLMSETLISSKTQADHMVISAMTGTVSAGIFKTALLASLGYIIELLDHIRWGLRRP